MLQSDLLGGISVPALGFFEGSIQLVPDGTLLLHLVLIGGMVALLNATLLKPINRILEEREQRTRGRLSEAAQTFATVDEKMREYERRLRQARTEGYAFLEKERSTVSGDRDRKVAEVRAEISRWISDEQEKLRSDTSEVKKTLEADARSVAMKISRQILQRDIG
ncbi:MAG TPA: ATP synthase F0 subunit B [Pyrinomonadaceae bacterium]|nr:ATP synthase F0 subunit B [Pyrinomonadaceae bacterium]